MHEVGTQIRFIGPEYDGAVDELGTFATKIVLIMKHMAGTKYGEASGLRPTDIEIAPIVIDDKPYFVVRSWLETSEVKTKSGILQPVIGAFDRRVNDGEPVFHHRVERGSNYALTSEEAFVVDSLASLATQHSVINSPLRSDTP